MASQEAEDDDVSQKAPLLVKIIGILSILIGILFSIGGILAAGAFSTLSEVGLPASSPFSGTVWGSFQMISYIFIASGISTGLQGWGLLKMKPWAWIMTAFFLLATIFLVIDSHMKNLFATSLDLSYVIVVTLIAGLLLAYFVKKKQYFSLDLLSTKITAMIIGGLVAFTAISMMTFDAASAQIAEWVMGSLLNQGLYSV